MAVGLVAFAGTATFVAAALASVLGALSPGIAWSGLIVGVAVGLLAGRAAAPEAGEGRPGAPDLVALACFAAAAVRQFGWIVHERAGVLYTLLPSNYGDLPLHWTYVAYIANGAPFWPQNPIAAGLRLRYPLGVDLLTAVLVQAGGSVPVLLITMGLVASALAGFALFAWGRGFAVAAFLFSGGALGFRLLAGAPWTEAVADGGLAWKNLFLTLFLPQRGFLFALPAGLLLLASARARLLRGERGQPAWVDGLLWGTLPLFHLHTFLFVSLIVGLWALWAGRVRAALPALAWALVPATFGVWQVTDGFRAASVVWWKPGWMIGGDNPLVFLALNFGLFLPAALLALVRAWREGAEERYLLTPGLALFAALFFVMLAPWDWDNTKVMLWCYLLIVPGIGSLVLARLRLPLRALAVIVLLFSGAVSVLAACFRPSDRIEVLRVAERDAVCAALAGASAEERVATVPTFNHPVALCGHPLVAGYAGHLWSHGIDARALQADLRGLMTGAPDWRERARRVGAILVFWGPREDVEYAGSARPWEATATLLAEGEWGKLYRLAD